MTLITLHREPRSCTCRYNPQALCMFFWNVHNANISQYQFTPVIRLVLFQTWLLSDLKIARQYANGRIKGNLICGPSRGYCVLQYQCPIYLINALWWRWSISLQWRRQVASDDSALGDVSSIFRFLSKAGSLISLCTHGNGCYCDIKREIMWIVSQEISSLIRHPSITRALNKYHYFIVWESLI